MLLHRYTVFVILFAKVMRDWRFSQCHILEYLSLQEGDTVPLREYMTSETTARFIPRHTATPRTQDCASTVRCLQWYYVHKFREELSAGSKVETGDEGDSRTYTHHDMVTL